MPGGILASRCPALYPNMRSRCLEIGDDMKRGAYATSTAAPMRWSWAMILCVPSMPRSAITITMVSPAGDVHRYRLVGIFNSGNNSVDSSTGYLLLSTAQVFSGRPTPSTISASRSTTLKQRAYGRQMDRGPVRLQGRFLAGGQPGDPGKLHRPRCHHVHRRCRDLLVAGFGIYNIISTITMRRPAISRS
jgi:hypothetical protein